jgi:aromatic ring hydroxylase
MPQQQKIHNDRSHKPYCCLGRCDEDATWHLQFGPGTEDFTHSCDEHISELADLFDVKDFRVIKLEEKQSHGHRS